MTWHTINTSLFDEKPPPGLFRGVCRMPGAWEPVPADLQAEWSAILAKPVPYGDAAALEAYRTEKARLEKALEPWRWDKERREHGRYPLCAFEADDPALFDTHMHEVHERKAGKRAVWKGDAAIRGEYTRPRLTKDGKPFEPQGLAPGAVITWRELVGTGVFRTESRFDYETERDIPFEVEVRDWVERSGQVWSGAPFPKSAWVIPFEPGEGERAVCVREEKRGGLTAHATWTASGYRDAA